MFTDSHFFKDLLLPLREITSDFGSISGSRTSTIKHIPDNTVMNKPKKLSPRQTDFVVAVGQLARASGYGPTLGELAAFLGVTVSRAHRLANETAARGAIVRDPRIPRSLRLPPPEDMT